MKSVEETQLEELEVICYAYLIAKQNNSAARDIYEFKATKIIKEEIENKMYQFLQRRAEWKSVQGNSTMQSNNSGTSEKSMIKLTTTLKLVEPNATN